MLSEAEPIAWNPAGCRGALFAVCRRDRHGAQSSFLTVPHRLRGLIRRRAERALRGAVLWRKASFGVWSHRGEQFRSRILGVVETCRMRGLSVMAVVHRIVAAVFACEPYPDVFSIGWVPSSQSG